MNFKILYYSKRKQNDSLRKIDKQNVTYTKKNMWKNYTVIIVFLAEAREPKKNPRNYNRKVFGTTS